MRLPTIRILAASALATASVSAYAQATFSTGGNVPVGANFYFGTGGVIDSGTDYFTDGANRPTNIESGNLAISPSFSFSQFAHVQTFKDGVLYAVSAAIYDGSDSQSAIYGNLNIELGGYSGWTQDFSANGYQMRFTFPQTVAGNIGYISGWELSPGGLTTAGFETAFDYTFDGAGSIYITPNGSFTAQEGVGYDLSINLTTTAVPEPATAALGMALVAGGLVALRRRRRA